MTNNRKDSLGEYHVHFSEDTDELGHTLVNIKKKSEFNYDIHVGFLQIYHKYKIIISLPLDNAKDYSLSNEKLQSMCIKDVSAQVKSDNELEFTIEFLAYKEKLLKDSIVLIGPDDKKITSTLFARVLGKGKGTPMLREGVTCIGVIPHEDESESSDWQGFIDD